MPLSRWVRTCKAYLGQKGYATTAVSVHDPTKLRNIALVAHIDSGKTTLTESILLKSSYLSSAGSVDTGSTTTDFLPAERERGITIQSASIPVQWGKWSFNLIDTPGHADFGMEVESASRVVDGAVVLIDSVEGVESQTKGVWRQLDRYAVRSRMIFLNKMDRPGSSFQASLASLLTHRFHPNPLAITLPVASFDPSKYLRGEPGIEGLVDLVKWELWKYGADGTAVKHPLPRTHSGLSQSNLFPSSHPLVPQLLPARTALMEKLSMFSEALMDAILSSSDPDIYLQVENEQIISHLREATLKNEILPVTCGSAIQNIGTDIVLDYVGELFASPVDVLGGKPSPREPFRALAWKVTWDSKRGWMSFVRIYSGKLTRSTSIYNLNRGQKEKAGNLIMLYAAHPVEVEELGFGAVGVILGLKHTRTGDTLVAASGPSQDSRLRDIIAPPAAVSASVIPESHSDLVPVQEALASLSRTDPSVRVDAQEGQLLVHGLGALHLEIVERRLRDEWKVKFELGQRRVSYRETLADEVDGSAVGITRADVAGTPVNVDICIRPLADGEAGDPLWEGNVVVDKDGKHLPPPDMALTNSIGYISSGISSSLSSSPHSSLPLSHVHVTIKSFQTPQPPSLLSGGSAKILRGLLRSGGIGPLMEPYFLFDISTPEDSLGKIVKDITERGGELLDLGDHSVSSSGDDVASYSEEGVYIPPLELSPSALGSSALKGHTDSTRLKRRIQVSAPLSQMLDYSTRLRALSGGHGQFEMVNAGFRPVSEQRKVEILREIGRA